ncbi:MAG: hypothetical protein EZS28_039699, partial [Streblomastix strix]
ILVDGDLTTYDQYLPSPPLLFQQYVVTKGEDGQPFQRYKDIYSLIEDHGQDQDLLANIYSGLFEESGSLRFYDAIAAHLIGQIAENTIISSCFIVEDNNNDYSQTIYSDPNALSLFSIYRAFLELEKVTLTHFDFNLVQIQTNNNHSNSHYTQISKSNSLFRRTSQSSFEMKFALISIGLCDGISSSCKSGARDSVLILRDCNLIDSYIPGDCQGPLLLIAKGRATIIRCSLKGQFCRESDMFKSESNNKFFNGDNFDYNFNEPMCQFKNPNHGAHIQIFSSSAVDFINSTIQECGSGSISVNDSSAIILRDCILKDNKPLHHPQIVDDESNNILNDEDDEYEQPVSEQYPSLQWNLYCNNRQSIIDVQKIISDQDLEQIQQNAYSYSLWMRSEGGCKMRGFAGRLKSAMYIPILTKTIVESKNQKNLTIYFSGENLLPCGLVYEVFTLKSPSSKPQNVSVKRNEEEEEQQWEEIYGENQSQIINLIHKGVVNGINSTLMSVEMNKKVLQWHFKAYARLLFENGTQPTEIVQIHGDWWAWQLALTVILPILAGIILIVSTIIIILMVVRYRKKKKANQLEKDKREKQERREARHIRHQQRRERQARFQQQLYDSQFEEENQSNNPLLEGL